MRLMLKHLIATFVIIFVVLLVIMAKSCIEGYPESPTHHALLPSILECYSVSDLSEGRVGWVGVNAIGVDLEGKCWIYLDSEMLMTKSHNHCIQIKKVESFFEILIPKDWRSIGISWHPKNTNKTRAAITEIHIPQD